MILSKAEYLNAVQLIESKPEPPKKDSPFPVQIRRRILNSTVKLTGGQLNGSGVIFNVTADSVSIVTAAHNAYLFKGLKKPPDNWNSVLTGQNGFIKKINIWYGTDDLKFDSQTTRSAAISDALIDVSSERSDRNGRFVCLYQLRLRVRPRPCSKKVIATFAGAGSALALGLDNASLIVANGQGVLII